MLQPVRIAGLVIALMSLVLVTPASAFDITGTWEGTYKCKGFDNGVKDKFEEELVAEFSQTSATAVGANISFEGTEYRYNGLAHATATKPDKGDLMLVICGSDDNLATGTFDELGRFTVSTKADKVKATIKGVSMYSTQTIGLQSYTCKWKLTRTSTSDPMVAVLCP